MQVFFTSQAAQSDEFRDPVVQRVNFVMRRMAWLVPTATVELSDVVAPSGGVDKRCLVELKTVRCGRVVVTSIARDWSSALDNALTSALGALRASGQERPQAGR